MMQCEIIRDLLPLYIDGLTGAETNREIEAHLTGCEACAKALEQLRVPVERSEPQAEEWQQAMKKNRSRSRRKLLLTVVAALIIGIAICLGALYSQDFFDIRARKAAPEGNYTAVLYQGSQGFTAPGQDQGFRIRLKQGNQWEKEIVYNAAEYLGMYWSPDGRFLAVNYRHEGVSKLHVIDTQDQKSKTFAAVLETAVKYYPALSWVRWQGNTPLLDCTFVHWSEDSRSILLSAGGTAADGQVKQGYFWYQPLGTQLAITGVTDFDGLTKEEQAAQWRDRVKQFRDWNKQEDLSAVPLIAGGYPVLARLLAQQAADCKISYYQYRQEPDAFIHSTTEDAWARLAQTDSSYAFAAFACGEVRSNAVGDMVCDRLYIVVLE